MNNQPDLPVFNTPVIPPRLDIKSGEVISARVGHAYSGEAVTPDDARSIARSLLEAADRADQLNAAVLPHLDAALAAAEELRV